MPIRNAATWNAAISGAFRAGLASEGMDLFREMREQGFGANGFVLASIVTACNRWGSVVGHGFEVHGLVLKLGLMRDVYVGTALVHLYGKCGFVDNARRFFEEMPERNVVSWTALMVSYSSNGLPEEAIRAYHEMRKEGVACNQNSFATVISSCGMVENEKLSLEILAHVIVSGFKDEVSVANSLITLFGKLGKVDIAEHLFNQIKGKDTISWNSMITVYSHEGMCEESLCCFAKMRSYNFKEDYTTLCCLISACNNVDHLKWGQGLHAFAISSGLGSFISVCNTLINMYSVLGKSEDSEIVFYEMPERDLISFNTMMSSYIQSGNDTDALKLFAQLLRANKEPNYVTFANALSACSNPDALLEGKAVHALIVHNNLPGNLLLGNSLITMYSKCNAMNEAKCVFLVIPRRDLISWNTLIGGHVENEEKLKAMQAFVLMREAGIRANYITMVNVLGICSATKDLMKYGMPLHSHIITMGFDSDEFVKNSLISMYAKCGDFDSSGFIFDGLESKTVVSWNAMISSKAHHGRGEEALKHFLEIHHAGVDLDRFNLSGAFAAAAGLPALEEGQQLHCLITKQGFDLDLNVTNAAMDMYSKCGKMDDVLKLLPEPSKRSRLSWNILISSYARHGLYQNAEDTFKEMLCIGPKPDYVTFVSLLSACSHGGLVDKGLEYYKTMSSDFGIAPRIEHCVCMVDLLGRAGRLIEAEKFIEEMPVSPNDFIFRSLLSSSRTQKNLDIGKRAAHCLLELAPSDDSAYVLLSNAYALNGMWEDVNKLRTHMKSIDLTKKPACSWIKLKNKVSSFGIGDWTHPQAKEIQAKLEEILQMVKELGYVPDTSLSLHDTDEEQIEHNLWNHSEKLALAYGLIEAPEGATIRVFKNLRVCGDCHLAYKLVSRAVDRELVLRDPYRFHHFRGGTCSCSDYW
ncbi:uncharacterized protein A4U43_C08F34740 [Asparagus officinalis]|uniref:pentatricopeptide repeat-containing protein At3g24000, mitochondrial n=1 Tax=Asparagus officinalis TaxID=4686 RepID=UPI00098E40F6|nr:pentatricopeptide repeat-containing protein At3g24000, mitochondrial [Asparagus officinalis]ONK61901.1 uncharacterized protein A4U43_C08F34740 [Asparagus officinalis]